MHIGMQPNRRHRRQYKYVTTTISNSLTLIALTIIVHMCEKQCVRWMVLFKWQQWQQKQQCRKKKRIEKYSIVNEIYQLFVYLFAQ